ncbi:MAG: tetratricopeptide repeat protein, partial [Chloroflexota bacterium]
ENAINLDASWAAPRLVLVQSHKLRNNYTAALNAIEDARAVNELQEDARFLVEGADIYFRQEDYDQASYEIFLALYVDPISALAHDLRTRIALAQEDESLASLYAQTYLYYHPLVVEGWLMLGQARELEGNTNLAVEAYTQAIVVGENTEQPLALDAYLFRADVYEQRGQYAQALADVTKAAEITNDPDLLARQLNLTFEAGDLDAALSLANDLRENEEVDVPRGAIDFVEARVVMAGETLLEGDFNRAIELIAGNFGTIPTELQPLANTLRAEAYAGLGNADSALSFAEQALNTGGETARVRMVLGAAYEARGEFAQALAEYERALTLAEITVVPASIPDAAQESIRRATNSLAQQEADATATANAR